MGQRQNRAILTEEAIGYEDTSTPTCFDRFRGTVLCCYDVQSSHDDEAEYLYSVTQVRKQRITSVRIPTKQGGKQSFIQPSVGCRFDEEGRKTNFLGPKGSDWLSSYSSYKSSPMGKK